MPPQIDDSAFRQAWLIRSRALSLYETGQIDRQQYEAVLWWRGSAELSRLPTQKWLAQVDGSRQPGNGVTEIELAAAAALRASALALGASRVGLLLAAVIQDRSWHDLGRQLGVDHKTAKSRVLEAIGALALWKAGLPVPPPRRERFRNQTLKLVMPRSYTLRGRARPRRLDPEDPGRPPGAPGREWRIRWWPADMHFENGPTERVVGRVALPLPGVLPGMYASTGQMAAESRFAEDEVDDRVRGAP